MARSCRPLSAVQSSSCEGPDVPLQHNAVGYPDYSEQVGPLLNASNVSTLIETVPAESPDPVWMGDLLDACLNIDDWMRMSYGYRGPLEGNPVP